MGPVSGKKPWIKRDIGEFETDYGTGETSKRIHESPLKVNKVTLQNLKEADINERKQMAKDLSKVKNIKMPDNSVETYFNGSGEIVDQTYIDDEGRTWELPNISPMKAREEIYTKGSMKHPAKMKTQWAQAMIQKHSKPGDTILDPMGGIGTTGVEASRLGRNAIIIDYEKRWVNDAKKNVKLLEKSGQKIGDIRVKQGDARNIKIDKKIDVIMFSPPYGHGGLKGMKIKSPTSIKKTEKKPERYSSYSPKSDNVGMKTGNQYTQDMDKIYSSCHNVLKKNGVMVVNTKNRVEQGKEIRFDIETQKRVEQHGFKIIEKKRVDAPPSAFRQIYEDKYPNAPKIHHEDFMVFKKI